MLSLRDFWRRHKRKAFVTAGALGSGYLLYKLYDAHRSRLHDLEKELADERENDEFIKTQMQAHFENIQRIADTTTLPHAMRYLSDRIAEEVDLSHLTERLMKEKGQRNTLTASEKLELWDKLKILSFTRMVLSLWAMTMLSLYIRVQVNILGRHLYIDTAHGLGSSRLLEEADLIDRDDQQKFLASSDFLSCDGMVSLISDIQLAVIEILKGKKLGDNFSTTVVHETIVQILDTFMSMRSSQHWVDYLMQEDSKSYRSAAAPSSGGDEIISEMTKFDQLMSETRAVLLSAEFGNVVDISLKAVVGAVVKDMETSHAGGGSLTSGMPLARILPRVAQMGPSLVEEPSQNPFIDTIRSVPEVQLFFTLLYASIGA